MIFDWLRRNKKEDLKNLPEFWKKYSQEFLTPLPEEISEVRFVVFDTETTGFDFDKDRILSIGAVSVINKSIKINQNFEVFLEQTTFNPETVKIHGIIRSDKVKKIKEEEALERFLDYIGNSVLVAHHASFDVKMINNALKRQGLPKLKNRILDTAILYKKTRLQTNLINRDKIYSLDEIAEAYNIEVVDRHTASGDAFITAIIFMKLLGRLVKAKGLDTPKLLRYRF